MYDGPDGRGSGTGRDGYAKRIQIIDILLIQLLVVDGNPSIRGNINNQGTVS
ncbi:hypothetical protein D3C73_1414430 [compost metagenome]